MYIETHSEYKPGPFKLKKNQIVILCKVDEVAPEEINFNGTNYSYYADTTFSKELQDAGYVIGKKLQTTDHVIQGCDEAESFNKIVSEKDLVAVASDIWNNPDKYSDYKKGSDGSYYHFLKYLFVVYPDGSEKPLGDIAISDSTK